MANFVLTTRHIKCLLSVIYYLAPSTLVSKPVCLPNIIIGKALQNLGLFICMPVLRIMSQELFNVTSSGAD